MTPEYEGAGNLPYKRSFLYADISIGELSLNPKSDSLRWGPTPLNPYYSMEISNAQEDVKHTLEQRTMEVPSHIGDVPEDIRSFVSGNFNSRFTHRVMQNFESFVSRLKQDKDGLTNPQSELIERAIVGNASPAELIYIRSLLGIESIELGCLTHPYGNNIEQLDDMRSSVYEAIELLGGHLLDESPEYEVISADIFFRKEISNHMNDVFAMTRTRDIGVLRDESIVRERSSFIIRTDSASGFDQRIAANMRKVPIYQNPHWNKHMALAGRLDEIVPGLLASNDFARAIPQSTTVYNFDRTTIALVKRRNATQSLAETALGQSSIAFMRKSEQA